MTFKLTNEISRDNHLASKAATAFASCIPLSDIEAVELEALASLIAAELQDRDLRKPKGFPFGMGFSYPLNGEQT